MKKWMIYLLYITVVTLIFLYYLFPTDAVTAYINYRISNSLPGVRVSAARIRPSFPPGLRFNSLVLSGGDKAIIGADVLKITPVYSTLFSSNKSFSFAADTCGGHLEGTARFSASGGGPGISMNLTFGGLQINRIQGFHEWIPPKLSGVAGGRVAFDGDSPPFGKGNAELAVSGCSLEFNPSLWGVTKLSFDRVDARLELSSRRLLLKQLEVKSDQVSGKAAGSIALTVPLYKSRLSISGRIMPRPGFINNLGGLFPVELFSNKNKRGGGIPFQVSGTVEHPDFKLK